MTSASPLPHRTNGVLPGWIFHNRVRGRARRITAGVRIAAGLLFIASAVPKITAHQQEIDMFVRFGFPRSSALVWLVTVVEIVAGLLLLGGLLTRLAAAAMAVNMAGAIVTAGVRVGGPIHLGLAPALLTAMLYLLWAGPGAAAVDRRWAAPSDRTDLVRSSAR